MSCSTEGLQVAERIRGSTGTGSYICSALDATYRLAAEGDLNPALLQEMEKGEYTREMAEIMARSYHPHIRALAAANPDTPPNLITRLATDPSDLVAKAAISNPNGPYAQTMQALASAGISNKEAFATIRNREKEDWKELPRCASCGCWMKASNPVCNNSRCRAQGQAMGLPARQWPPNSILAQQIDPRFVNPYGPLGYLREGDNATRAAYIQMEWEDSATLPLSPEATALLPKITESMLSDQEDYMRSVGVWGVSLGHGYRIKYDEKAGTFLFSTGDDGFPDTPEWIPVPATSASGAIRSALRYMEMRGYKFLPLNQQTLRKSAQDPMYNRVRLSNALFVTQRTNFDYRYIQPPDPSSLPPSEVNLAPATNGRTEVDYEELFASTLEDYDKEIIKAFKSDVSPLLKPGWRADQNTRKAVRDAMLQAAGPDRETDAELIFYSLWQEPGKYDKERPATQGLVYGTVEFIRAAKAMWEARRERDNAKSRADAAAARLKEWASQHQRSFKIGPVLTKYTPEHDALSVRYSALEKAITDGAINPADIPWIGDVRMMVNNPASVSFRIEDEFDIAEPDYSNLTPTQLAQEYVSAIQQYRQWQERYSEIGEALSPVVVNHGQSIKAGGMNMVYKSPTSRAYWSARTLQEMLNRDSAVKQKYPQLQQALSTIHKKSYTSVSLEKEQ